jgi:hypothetical protein
MPRCEGKTGTGKRCTRDVEDIYCFQHINQNSKNKNIKTKLNTSFQLKPDFEKEYQTYFADKGISRERFWEMVKSVEKMREQHLLEKLEADLAYKSPGKVKSPLNVTRKSPVKVKSPVKSPVKRPVKSPVREKNQLKSNAKYHESPKSKKASASEIIGYMVAVGLDTWLNYLLYGPGYMWLD